MADPGPAPPQPPPARPRPFAVRLSPRGRERFGELLAKQLWLTAGGLSALVIVPVILGAATVEPGLLAVVGAAIPIMVVAGSAIHYITVERADEATGAREPADD